MLSNKTAIEKLDLAVSDLTSGGLLVPAQAKQFMRIMIAESVLLSQVTAVPMKSPKQEINKIRFASRILRAGQESTALAAADRAKPTLGKTELDAQLFKAEVRIPDEVLEDNIEGDTLKNTIMTLMGEAIGRDMEEVVISGDTTSADPFLASFDGLIKLATSHVVNAGASKLLTTVLKNMLRSIPAEFVRKKKSMKYYTSINAENDYRDSLGQRATVMGDKATLEEMPTSYGGIDVEPVPLMPGDLSGTTSAILTDPKNIQWGLWRQIKVKTGELISEGVQIVVASLRADVAYAEETAVVKATNIAV